MYPQHKGVRDTGIACSICSMDAVLAQAQQGYRAPVLFYVNANTAAEGQLWYRNIMAAVALCSMGDNKAPGIQASTIQSVLFSPPERLGEQCRGVPRLPPEGQLKITWVC